MATPGVSPAQICNNAMILIGENPIVTATFQTAPTGEVERLCNQQYSQLRDAELRANLWNFAKTRASLAAHGTAPLFGWDNAFPVPGDFLRLRALDEGDDWSPAEGVDYTLDVHPATSQLAAGEASVRAILTDYDAPLKITYTRRVTNVELMDALFQQALSARIGMVLAPRIAEDDASFTRAKREYQDKIADADLADALEKPPVPHTESSFITVRG